jgi:hypothetical protein
MIGFLLSPLYRWAIGALVIAALLGGFIIKQRHNAVVAERARVEQEKQDAIKKADEARERVRAACEHAPDKCVPDDWHRD